MPYNAKQYEPALPFFRGSDDNIVADWDKKRVSSYDLYENIYSNSVRNLIITLRGVDSVPLLVPSGRKIIEATHRFLAKGFDYFVDQGGDEGIRAAVELWFAAFFKREACRAKFTSNKRWGLVRGDAHFYIHANPNKPVGERICLIEMDPRQVFLIEDSTLGIIGCHIVDTVRDWRERDATSDKMLARRRTFRKTIGPDGQPTGEITTELTHWTLGNWDDRGAGKPEKDRIKERVPSADFDEQVTPLPASITQLPIYRWRNKPPQNSDWGTSQLEGLETLMYAINQSLTDEDATIVFQGLGMYVTNAAPPIDPNTGEITDWNIGPMQIIEIGVEQKFDRVTGVSDVSPFQDHMNWISEKGLGEAAGLPDVAVGRVDVAVAESGISLQLQLSPLLSANEEKEEELIVVMDQMLHDITTMWLPAYESETFDDAQVMKDIVVVAIFDDPTPKNPETILQDTILLHTSNLILTVMAVQKLREIGWKYPQTGPTGAPLTDDDIVALLNAQAEAAASLGLSALGPAPGPTDAQGNPVDQFGNPVAIPGQTPVDQTTIPL
jgi:hypothetical protein